MNAKKLRGEYVLIEPEDKNEATPSGIILSKTAEQGDFSFGVVKVVGTGKTVEGVGHIDIDLEPGDKVMFRYGQKIKFGDTWLLLVNESDVHIVLE